VIKSILPIVNERSYSLVRQNAAMALPKVFASLLEGLKAGSCTSAQVDSIVGPITRELLSALKTETQAETAISFADGIKGVIMACYESGGSLVNGVQPPPAYIFPLQMVDVTLQTLSAAAMKSVQRRVQAQANVSKLGDDVYDSEEAFAINQSLDVEEDLMTNITDAVGFTIKQHKEGALASVEKHVLPTYGKLLNASQFPPSLQHNAICVFDDMIEHCSPSCHRHLASCAGPIIMNMNHEECYMRCAVRGFCTTQRPHALLVGNFFV